MNAQGAGHERLIGREDGRLRLPTPALLVELDHLESNLRLVAEHCATAGIGLRPHVKGHKCEALARLQLASGALGLSCTTMAEAELMAETGARSLLLTSPVIGEAAVGRLRALSERVAELLAVVDDQSALAELEAAFAAAARPLRVLVDLDVGQMRTGVEAQAFGEVAALAQAVEATPGLTFAGLQAYYGHFQGMASYAEREASARTAQGWIRRCIEALGEAGLVPAIVSGGGTGTLTIDSENAPFSELQPGSYPFLDLQYGAEELVPDDRPWLRQSLFVRGRVISAAKDDRVTIDVGMKATSTDGGPPRLIEPGDVWADYAFAGDEHGFLLLAPGSRRPKLGEAVELMPSHCDTTTNLHAALFAVRGRALEAVWPIGARGCW